MSSNHLTNAEIVDAWRDSGGRMPDTEILAFLVASDWVGDGWTDDDGNDHDRHELAFDAATEAGRDEPNGLDEVEGFRRLVEIAAGTRNAKGFSKPVEIGKPAVLGHGGGNSSGGAETSEQAGKIAELKAEIAYLKHEVNGGNERAMKMLQALTNIGGHLLRAMRDEPNAQAHVKAAMAATDWYKVELN